jgi:hypothetical protein
LTLELAVLAPACLVLLALVVAAGRIQIAGGAVEQASAAAAREASLARSAAGAHQAATAAATDSLASQRLRCTDVDVTVDTSGFAVPVGQAAQVRATVSCTVSLGDLSVPGVPGSRTLTARTTSVLDRYRSR